MAESIQGVPGVQVITPGNGQELVEVNAGAVKAVMATQVIAALGARTSTAGVLTTLNTVGAGSLTAAAIVGGDINRTGVQTGAFTDTTVAASAIIAALPAGAPVGTSWLLRISNNQTGAAGYVETISGGSGVTVSGITTIPTGGAVEYLVTLATASTITMVGRLAADAGASSFALAGATSGQVTVQVPGVAGTSVLTLPAVTDQLVGQATADNLTNKTITDAIQNGNTVATSTLTSTTTALANVTGLAYTLTGGGTYNFRIWLQGSATTTGGLKVAFSTNGAVAATNFNAQVKVYSGTTLVSNANVTSLGSNLIAQTAIYSDAVIDGSVVVQTGGSLTLQAAQNAQYTTTGSTVVQGSYMEIWRVS